MKSMGTDLLYYRKQTIKNIETTEFEILVIGGGITGAGIARDAALRGYSVALIEKNDFGNGTSSGSSKLVHAGMRYLTQKEFRLVREASVERKKILEMAPHLTRPIEFIIPFHSDTITPKNKIRKAVWLYDILAGFRNYSFHKIMDPKKATSILPKPIREENFQGAALYSDGLMDDARLSLDIILSADQNGASVLNYCQAESFSSDSSGEIKTVIALDKIQNKEFKIKANLIVLACGHWTDRVIRTIDSSAPERIRPTKGVHIITRRFHNKDSAIVVPVDDGRLIFLVPFGNYLLIGTTDTDYSDDYDVVPVTREDILYLINAINFIFPDALREEDVISAYSGLRPLIVSPTEKTESETSRKDEIFTIKPNIYAIAGGKYTTYRTMAKRVVDRLAKQLGTKKKCKTDKVPLFGWFSTKRKHWDKWATMAMENLTIRYKLPEDVARNLLRYGRNYKYICDEIELNPQLKERISDNRSSILAEINYAIKYEKAVTLNDIMFRRTQLQLSDTQGLDCVENVANHMAGILGWSSEIISFEIENYKESLVWKP